MSTTLSCPRCGNAIEQGSKFCSECGADMTRAPGQEASPGAATAAMDVEQQMLDMLRSATLGEFEILKELGRGGMAMVYLGHDIALNRKVAIKVMSPALGLDESMIERFKREAQTAASLSHPNIIPVYAVKQTDQLTYFIMKFVPGRPLDSIMEELGPMPIPMVKAILTQVASGLGYGHKRGIVHRDVKPGNVMIDDEGWAILTDFGIAKVDSAQGLTQTGAAIGTPTYMSPEQCTAAEVTGASDQYSLGVMAYEMVAGRKPFEGDSIMTIMYGHVNQAPPPIREVRPDCPPELEAAIMRMLQKKAEDRFEAIEEMADMIGGGPLKHNDPTRTEMMTLASAGLQAKLIEQVSTPRSPIPLVQSTPRTPAPALRSSKQKAATAQSDVSTDPNAATVLTSEPTPPSAQAVKQKKNRKVLIAVVALVVVGGAGGALALQPWATGDDVAQPPVQASDQPVAGQDGAGAVVASVELRDATSSMQVNQASAFGAVALGADGSELDREVSWFSSDPAVLRVSNDGLAEALSPGTVTLTASSDGQSASTEVTVSPAPTRPSNQPVTVRSVDLIAPRTSIEAGERLALRLNATGSDGSAMSTGGARWRSEDNSVATVDASGQVVGVSVGTARITATLDGRSDAVTIRVEPPAVSQLAVTPQSVEIPVGETRTLSVRVLDTRGGELTDATVAWRSSNTSVATVSNGTVTAVAPGAATITASIEGLRTQAQVTVPEPVAAAPVRPSEAESRQQIVDLIGRYERALDSQDIERVRAVYPAMSGEFEERWSGLFREASEFDATLTVRNVTIDGDEATAAIRTRYDMRTSAGHAEPELDQTARLRWLDGSWQLVSIQ